jgi:hypothetical protein
MNLSEAKKIFFQYDGSLFYMSRDGADSQYAEMNIPKETETLWLEELTSEKVESLKSSGNWHAIHFFINHDDHRHVENIMAVTPKGELWEKCAFLEEFLKYLSILETTFSISVREKALKYILEHSNSLLLSGRSNDSRKRILAIINDVNYHLSKLDK